MSLRKSVMRATSAVGPTLQIWAISVGNIAFYSSWLLPAYFCSAIQICQKVEVFPIFLPELKKLQQV